MYIIDNPGLHYYGPPQWFRAPYGFADAVAGQKSTKSAALEEHLATTERTLEPLLLQVRATIARARVVRRRSVLAEARRL